MRTELMSGMAGLFLAVTAVGCGASVEGQGDDLEIGTLQSALSATLPNNKKFSNPPGSHRPSARPGPSISRVRSFRASERTGARAIPVICKAMDGRFPHGPRRKFSKKATALLHCSSSTGRTAGARIARRERRGGQLRA